ncbi:DUF4974 domain-containing protein [Pricia sp. S334]|uniref:DUF4974 domain-containing protein n=1 Tax=Pricia mediterranea TaxID=3076079 RepID=A0ABU3L9D2_9FLAO|nr:FecR domain-containing protein [Pricia sp. S334]MDT7830339.1 DUF4974 domain-containing protein [Pricia sp. S334]
MGEYDSEKVKQRLLKRIRQDKRDLLKRRALRAFQYTVVGLVCLGLGYGYYTMSAPHQDVRMLNHGNEIVLQQSDGSYKAIRDNINTSIRSKNGRRIGFLKGNQLLYYGTPTTEELGFNTLSVPYKKQFKLILGDGTKVHLNAGTTLKYPVQFKSGSEREVFLDGEGYFEVARDQEHPFIVNTNALNIQVLGTEFNVSAYSDDVNISTVLVEGSVGFFERDETFDAIKSQRLDPGHIANWQKKDGSMQIEETDTDLYTGWMEGKIIFNHTPFKKIRKILERNYNVVISNGYEELDEVRFTASFDTETIEQVLHTFSKNYPMRYTVDDREIVIKKP